MNPDEHDYCPGCKAGKLDYKVEAGVCKDCGHDVREEWPQSARLKEQTKRAAALIGGVGILFGPFVYAAWVIVDGLLNGAPLFGYKAVEVTTTVYQPTGILSQALAPLLIGCMVWVVVLFMAYGPRY